MMMFAILVGGRARGMSYHHIVSSRRGSRASSGLHCVYTQLPNARSSIFTIDGVGASVYSYES